MQEQPIQQKPSKKSDSYKWIALLSLVAVVLSIGAAVYFYADAQDAKSQTTDAVQSRNLEESARVIAELKTVLFVDDAEADPTVAKVEDPAVLQESNPQFYKNAEVGDYLVLYPTKAVVYRSDEKKIVNIAPIINTIQTEQAQQEQSTQAPVEGTTQP